ncbi:metallophosphoesterase [Gottschalkiaceae bacterium SANA]|nr:metallophosphoesterase [Gottschalkiaceae bacterium SANA]
MKKKLIKIVIFLLVLSAFAWTQNEWIQVTNLNYESNNLPDHFDKYKILQISDLHNHRFGSKQNRLLKSIETISPDLIVVTGDLIDRRRYDLEPIRELLANFPKLPTYYVSGNHEIWSANYAEVKSLIEVNGWNVLENETAIISRGEDSIQLIGLMDPASRDQGDIQSHVTQKLNAIPLNHEDFTILLSHRPNPFEVYANYPIDLVFSGHAHGGQFRLPFLGGFIAPDQGLFPTYTEGAHTLKQTTMIVSRGLGNSIIPLRVFNRPELLVVTLEKK